MPALSKCATGNPKPQETTAKSNLDCSGLRVWNSLELIYHPVLEYDGGYYAVIAPNATASNLINSSKNQQEMQKKLMDITAKSCERALMYGTIVATKHEIQSKLILVGTRADSQIIMMTPEVEKTYKNRQQQVLLEYSQLPQLPRRLKTQYATNPMLYSANDEEEFTSSQQLVLQKAKLWYLSEEEYGEGCAMRVVSIGNLCCSGKGKIIIHKLAVEEGFVMGGSKGGLNTNESKENLPQRVDKLEKENAGIIRRITKLESRNQPQPNTAQPSPNSSGNHRNVHVDAAAPPPSFRPYSGSTKDSPGNSSRPSGTKKRDCCDKKNSKKR